MNAPQMLLRGHEITRRWGGLVAVSKVSIELERGTVHAVIAAGAVVLQDVAAHTMVAGVPATLRKRVDSM